MDAMPDLGGERRPHAQSRRLAGAGTDARVQRVHGDALWGVAGGAAAARRRRTGRSISRYGASGRVEPGSLNRFSHTASVGMSADAARMSACATFALLLGGASINGIRAPSPRSAASIRP